LVQPPSYAGCKVLDARDHRAELDRFTQLLVRLLHVRLRPGNSGADRLGSRLEVLEFDGSEFVGVYDALQRSLMRREGAQCFGMVRAQLIGDTAVVAPARPFVHHALGILKQFAHRFPNVAVELIDAHLMVLAHATGDEAIGIRPGAAVVRILFARRRKSGSVLCVESVVAARANGQALEQVSPAEAVSPRESLVALELLVGGIEDFTRHDRGHVDEDPVLARRVAVRALRTAGHGCPSTDRSRIRARLACLRLTERRFAHVRRIPEDRAESRLVPLAAPTRRDRLVVQLLGDLAERLLLTNEAIEDPAHDLRLVQQNFVARRGLSRLPDVGVAVGSTTERADQSLARVMELSATTAFEDLRAFVLCDHALHLDEQLILRGLAAGPVHEDDTRLCLPEFVEQDHLIGVSAREPIRAVHIEHIDRTFVDAIAESFEGRSHQRRSAEAVIKVDVRRKHRVPVGLRTLLQLGDLTLHRRLLHLLLRRNPRVQGDRLHRRLRVRASSARELFAGFAASAAFTIARSVDRVTISYVSRRYSLDIRVGENATRILSPRRIDRHSQHTRSATSKKLQTRRTIWARPYRCLLRWSGVRARSKARATHARHWNWAIA
jgi:hypothetical protein